MKERYQSTEMSALAGSISAAIQFHIQQQNPNATERELYFKRSDAIYSVKLVYVGGVNFTAKIAINYQCPDEYLEDGESFEQGVAYIIDSKGVAKAGYLDKSYTDGSEVFFTSDPAEIKHFSSQLPSSVFPPPPITKEELTLLNKIAMDPLNVEKLIAELPMPADWSRQ